MWVAPPVLSESAPLRAQLSAISEAAERTVEAVRRIALSLRPSMLDDLGLVAALEWQAREVGNRTGRDVEVCAEDSAGRNARRATHLRLSRNAGGATKLRATPVRAWYEWGWREVRIR
jgi:signal transduction histidine kinase